VSPLERPITVLIVESMPAVAELLSRLLGADPAIRVVGVVSDAQAAVSAASRLRPSVITMDIHMPHMDGFEATRRIMETCPAPIVMVSGGPPEGAAGELRAVAAGALASVPRPADPGHPDHAESARRLIETVKLMSEVKVVRRWPRRRGSGAAPPGGTGGPEAMAPACAPPSAVLEPAGLLRLPRGVRAVAIGASTGGPLVLQSILGRLPKELPAPVLIVQHMAPGFVDSFAEWLSQSTGFPVRLPASGESLLPGVAYVAPDGLHMGVGADGRVLLSRQAPENGVRPAVSFLFRSLHAVLAPHVVAVLLTGMGRDGVDELKRLKDAGAVTIAQDQKSSVIFGMPGQAVEAGAVSHVLPPDAIARALATLALPE